MTTSLRRRLLLFSLASGALICFVIWAAASAWLQISTMRQGFNAMQFETLRIAGHFQASIGALHSALMSFEIQGENRRWDDFQQEATQLDTWLTQEKSILRSPPELEILARIESTLQDFVRQAGVMAAERRSSQFPTLARMEEIERGSNRLLALDSELADAHERALGDFLDGGAHSLRLLELFLVTAFAAVLGVVIWGARMAYRYTVAPLQTQLIESQALLERREKLASLGVLAAGVAHEIRNPLTAIKARLFTQQKRLSRDSAPFKDSEVISGEIQRLERIVRDFLEFARPGEPERSRVNAERFLREVCELMQPELEKNGVTLQMDPSPDAPLFVDADQQQLKQVLINLIRNAAESLPGRGLVQLGVRLGRIRLDDRKYLAAVLEVTDNGPGIPPEVQQRLFDPFYTTKSNGTGLGLSIAAQIVEKHEGRLQFQTERGTGTTFAVTLPLEPRTPAAGRRRTFHAK